MNWPNLDRWLRLWEALDASGDPKHWYETLTQVYAEPRRHYHNQQHIAECLAEFEGARPLMKQPEAVELALWFHDAVYDPKANDNEEKSAAMAKSCLEEAGLARHAATVGELVMATKHHRAVAGSDAALTVDVDLSILGQNEQRFAEYEAQIREEYRFVPKMIFNFKRAEILQRFLDRRQIFATEYFAAKYELNARRNLENSIRKLKRLWN